MFTCIICQFDCELDDVVVLSPLGTCICLRCFNRETGSTKPMPKGLRTQIAAVANGAEI